MKPLIEFGDKKLYLTLTIVEYDFMPVVNCCNDENNQQYLCLLAEVRYGIIWVVGKTYDPTLQHLLRCDITLNEAITKYEPLFVVHFTSKDGYFYEEFTKDTIDPLLLAEDGLYMKYIEEEAQEWLNRKDDKQ